MRIAHLISRSGCSSGGSIQALVLARSMLCAGREVFFVSKGGDCEKRALEMGLPHVSLSMHWSVRGVVEAVKRLRCFDVLHAHKGRALSFAILSSLVNSKGKVFANRGVSFPLAWSNLWKYKLPLVKRIICVSHSIRQLLAKQGINTEKLKVVYGSVPDSFFVAPSKGIARSRLDLKDGLYIGLVGNFRPWKGHILLARAFSALPVDRGYVKLLFVGKEKGSVLEQVKRLVGDAVVSLGYRKDMDKVMPVLDVLVNASTCGEGIPGVVREAMASGVPVVASSLEGNREVVVHGKNGLIFPVEDEASLARLLLRVIFMPGLSKRLVINGRLFVQRFRTSVRAERIVKIYECC